VGALGRTLRYLGLAGPAESDSLTADLAAHRGSRHEPAALGEGLVFKGELGGDGDFYIAGRFEGDINVTGRVLVGEGAEVDANINARAIVVGGTVRGNLSAATRVEILPTGVLTGTLRTGSFSAADGAEVKGEIWIERAADGREPERRS
jgi:cytoskeletal protein CcmA (bactofilin family)